MKKIKVWDLFVRLFHWSLVGAVITQLATAEDLPKVHVAVGYGIIILVLARIVWGFIGSRYARFIDFVYPPREIIAYLKGLVRRQPKHYVGHNPAGGAMVCLLLIILLLVTMAGLKTLGSMGKGPLANGLTITTGMAYADEDHEEEQGIEDHHDQHSGHDHFWKEIHETLVGILIFLASLHVCGVIASSFVHKENLIGAMFTGKKSLREDS